MKVLGYICVLATALVVSEGFINSHHSHPPMMRKSSTSSSSMLLAATVEDAPTATAKNPELVPKDMGEGIYRFNKILIDTVYNIICFFYPVKGTDRDFARFFVLETVARVPYFAYLSVLHLRETFGERKAADEMSDRMRTHYAEADNELHHLLIMESLGGNSTAIDRNLAHTAAFVYYWYVVAVYMFSPPVAYHLSELIGMCCMFYF
jgi:hypothetical protein